MSGYDGAHRVSPAAWLLILPIRFYQRFITPYTPATCRYYPTCSAYAVGALRTHGAVKGLALTVWRVLRCNPWSSGGVDKVPPRGFWRNVPVATSEVPAIAATGEAATVAASGVADAAPGSGGRPRGAGHDGALGPGPRPGPAFGRAAAGTYVISGSLSASARRPDMTTGDGTHAADDTARPGSACAPSAGRTAA